VSSSSDRVPSTPFNGVRTSWLTTARKSDFSAFARSAARRARRGPAARQRRRDALDPERARHDAEVEAAPGVAAPDPLSRRRPRRGVGTGEEAQHHRR
jgi:hypothetical protein